MDLGLEGKIAIVAASSRGLGKATARGLAEEGARLSIFSRDREEIERTAREIADETGAEVLPLAADVTRREDIERVVSRTLEKYSTVDIVINNAGGPPFGRFEDFSYEQWKGALELNLLSTVNLTNAALPMMKKQKWGRIVNITSIAVKEPLDGLILSNTSRTGVIGLAKTLSRELAPFNILVNSVCPGRIMTSRIVHLAEERARERGVAKEDVFDEWERDIPLGRLGKPQELADLIVFLVSERASYITGATIQVDGGALRTLF